MCSWKKPGRGFVVRLRYQDYLGEVAMALDKTVYKTERLIERKVKRKRLFSGTLSN
ncbi:MAG: hypothetical protein R2825_28140 [Saprospiraceae bacterium]